MAQEKFAKNFDKPLQLYLELLMQFVDLNMDFKKKIFKSKYKIRNLLVVSMYKLMKLPLFVSLFDGLKIL
jgi:hypothetical protein